jgi:hypothetical protein
MDRILIIEKLDFDENFNKINKHLSKNDFNFDVIIIKSSYISNDNNNNNFVNLPLGLKLCIVDYFYRDIKKFLKIPFDCMFKVLDENKEINTRYFVYNDISDYLTNYNYKKATITHIKYNIIRKSNYYYNYFYNKKHKLIKLINKKPYLVYEC